MSLIRLIAAFLWVVGTTNMLVAQSLSDTDIGETLALHTDNQKVKSVLLDLKIPEEMAEAYAGGYYDGPVGIEWSKLRNNGKHPVRLLFLPCMSTGGASLYLYESIEEKWVLRDSLSFDCHYDDTLSYQILQLTSVAQYDVMVHHACEAHGTGYLEQHTKFYRLSHLRFVQILDQTDVLHSFPVAPFVGGIEEKSAFITFGKTVEQTKSITPFGEDSEPRFSKVKVERRTLTWSSQDLRFHISPWTQLR